jgi:hypothetical protein
MMVDWVDWWLVANQADTVVVQFKSYSGSRGRAVLFKQSWS